MFYTFRFRKIVALILAVVLLILAAFLVFHGRRDAAQTSGAAAGYVLVIDPGHGGIDGGAIAADGTRESAINLAVAQKMAAVAGLYGWKYVLTRNSDESDVTIDEYSEHDSLVKRAETANSVQGAVLISVHQNNFPTAQPTGAEVMYAPTDGSRELGETAQDNLVHFVDPENRRVASPAPDKLLLTRSVTCPAILAECGFMSNPDEAAKLSTDEYQIKIACALTAAFFRLAEGETTA
jgi:N-acetylmuramoyl-L-alanine amidase